MDFFVARGGGPDLLTGIVHPTRDDSGGALPSDPDTETAGSRVGFLYRYIPRTQNPAMGALQKGGELQVMTFE